jgi:glycosyltransferase involved in cell wall biosynthesis
VERKMIDIWHNIVWSRYKGAVFSALHRSGTERGDKVRFYQIAETEGNRAVLTPVDMSVHTYPFRLMFQGAYGSVPFWRLMRTLFRAVWHSNGKLILLPGYHRPEYWGMLLAAIIKRKKRAVFCDSTIYDQPQTFFKGLLKRLFFSQCDGFFCYGERSKQYLIQYGAKPDKIWFRRQAAALPPGYSVEMALKHRIEQGPQTSDLRILYVGRLSSEKSLDVLLKAFANVLDVRANASLILVGAGPQEEELRELATRLGLNESSVEFAGSMDMSALATEYSKASCLVLPSVSEPWGLVVNEALSYGCPVVVSNRCGCVPELLGNQTSGLIFEAGNVEDLTSRLLTVNEHFSEVEKTALACVELIAHFSPENAAKDILDGCAHILSMK